MEIHEQRQNGMLIMRISHQIDSLTSPALGKRLDAVVEKGETNLILDLRDVPYISSAGLRVLSITLKALRAPDRGGDMYLANLSNTVAHAFRISGFDQVFCIYDTVSEATIAMAASIDLDLGE
jgi:anti-sigma B factor antagonist